MKHLCRIGLLAALVAAPLGLAHGGPSPKGFLSKVTRIDPAVSGLTITILGGDERMRVVNRSGKTVVFNGYDGEPYARFGPDGVYVNDRSPAAWLNIDRLGETPVPPEADPTAVPRWQKVAEQQRFVWHEHRAQWMSPILPPRVLRSPDERHFVFDWTVPGTVDGRPLTIAGTLEYAPPGSGASSFPWAAIALGGTAVVVVLVGLLLFVARTRTEAEEVETA